MSAKQDVQVRPVDEMDLSEIVTIDEQISGQYRPNVWEQRVFYFIRRDPVGSFVAEIDGRVVGFMLGEVRTGEFGLEEPTGWVEVVGVDPECRGHAVGRRLAEAMFDRFRQKKAVKVRTLVDQSLPGLLHFFAALGFETSPLTALSLDLDGSSNGDKPASGDSGATS